MAFRVLCSFKNIEYSWEEGYSNFREEVTENEIKTDKNTSKRYSKELQWLR